MKEFYANVEQEIREFIQRCQNPVHAADDTSSSIACLTTTSFDTLARAIERLDTFIDFLSRYTSEISIDSDPIIAIVSECSSLVNDTHAYQCLFIEYALDDYLLLDEHFDLLYRKVLQIIDYLHHLPTTNAQVYHLQHQLRALLPSTYLARISTTALFHQITSTLIAQTSRLFSSSYHSLANENEDDENDCIVPSSSLFSSSPHSITVDNHNAVVNLKQHDSFNRSRSTLQLDKINIRTTNLTQSQVTPSFQFDLTDFEQIENDLDDPDEWMKIERGFFINVISVWSNEQPAMPTINPWSSETFWTLIMHFQCSDMNLRYEFLLVIQWCFCSLAIQGFNRDWDLFYSKTLINTIMVNRWRTVFAPDSSHLSIVGHNLNQMFLRLARIATTLRYMKVLAEQSSYLTSFFTNLVASNVNTLSQQIEGTFQLLIVWLDQRADAFVNANSLERALLICRSDHMQLSTSVNHLIDALRQLQNCQQPLKLVMKLHSACETIVTDTMAKLYRRIQSNTTGYFTSELPLTANEWRLENQPTSYMITGCDRLLKPMISQTECLRLDKKFDIHEHVLQAFLQAWTTVLLERKYRFCEDMIHILQKDYDYLLSFLSTNISDEETTQALQRSPAIQEIALIIKLLKTGDKNGSGAHIPNQDKWLHSRKSSSSLLECFRSVCCCHRRNRVTTGPS